MRKISWLAAAAAALALVSGCSSVSPAATPAPPPIGASTAPVGGTCDAQAAQWALGRNGTAKVLEEARVRAGARMARVLHKGQPVTMEFDAQRLNLEVDGSGKITAARCG